MIAQKIKQARLAAGYSLDDCVKFLKNEDLAISKPALSQYENDKRTPNALILRKLGKILSVPSSWFIEPEGSFSISWFSYRAQASLGKRHREAIQAHAALIAEKNAAVCDLFPNACKVNFPDRKKITSIDDADEIAANLRKQWQLGLDALESVTQTLETQGAMVVHANRYTTSLFDGLSALVNNTYPLLIINSNVAPDRLRFDIAHEIGHVLMDTHALCDKKKQEYAAHRFASSFLILPDILKKELGTKRANLSLSELLLLKEKFGISVGALLYSAKVHRIITAAHYTSLQIQLSSRGWRKEEPAVFTGNEQPTRMRQLVMRAVAEDLLGLEKACTMFPEFAATLRNEFSKEPSTVSLFRKESQPVRNAALRKAAEKAAIIYENNPDIIVKSGGDYHEYE